MLGKLYSLFAETKRQAMPQGRRWNFPNFVSFNFPNLSILHISECKIILSVQFPNKIIILYYSEFRTQSSRTFPSWISKLLIVHFKWLLWYYYGAVKICKLASSSRKENGHMWVSKLHFHGTMNLLQHSFNLNNWYQTFNFKLI